MISQIHRTRGPQNWSKNDNSDLMVRYEVMPIQHTEQEYSTINCMLNTAILLGNIYIILVKTVPKYQFFGTRCIHAPKFKA